MRIIRFLFTQIVMGAAFCSAASAYELGFPAWQQKPGVTLGSSSAAAPPPGIYMFDTAITFQAQLAGPGAPMVGGVPTPVRVATGASGLLFVPGWTFLGATYDAVIVQSFLMSSVGAPINVAPTGMHNTYVVPAELSWKLGDSGVFVKTGLGMYVPDGTITGPNGLSSVGNPWWTFQPEFIVSYIKDGWSATANIFVEMNTASTVTGYRSGDVLHAEFSLGKRFEKWTLGPVAYYVGQVSDDKSSAFYRNAINVNRYDVWSAGGRVSYDFGPLTLNVWALHDVSATASGTTPTSGAVPKGWTAFAQISYQIWSPDPPKQSPQLPIIRK